MKKITKVEIKRLKDLEQVLKNRLGVKLIDFKDNYLEQFLSWNIRNLKSIANRYPDLRTFEEFKLKYTILSYREFQNLSSCSNRKNLYTNQEVYSIFNERNRAEDRLKRINLLTRKYYNEAFENYEGKFNILIKKMVDSGIEWNSNLTIENIAPQCGEFEFLISDTKVQIHARIIFACGAIKAPHYRFITTVKKL